MMRRRGEGGVMRIKIGIVVALAAGVLAGCGDSPTESSVGGATSPAGLGPNVRYESIYDLREKVEEAGTTCTDWSIVAEPTNAVERASCTSAVVLSIHRDAAQVQRSIEAIAEVTVAALDRASVHLIGPNWSVNCGDSVSLCEGFRDVLGGEVSNITP